MSELDYLMVSFNDELSKQANTVSSVGMRALESALSGLKSTAGAAKRFGQRQAHGLTGWTPKGFMNPEGIRDMRGGAYDAMERLTATERSAAPGVGKYRPGLVDRVLGRSEGTVQSRAVKSKAKEVAEARKAYQASQKAEDMGLTSLPGYARALMRNPGEAISTGFAEQWHNVGPGGKAMMVGLPTLGAAGELSRPSNPGEGGRFERAGTRLGELAYTMGPLPIAGQLVAGGVMGGLGKRMGSVFDRKKPVANVPAPPSLEPAGGEAAPAERHISDRAMGLGQGGFQ
jgi:hypothetical protein